MIHARKDYNCIQDPRAIPSAKSSTPNPHAIPRDEPVFLLRAQDPLFDMMLTTYAMGAQLIGCDPRMIQSVIAHRELARLWPVKKVKADL